MKREANIAGAYLKIVRIDPGFIDPYEQLQITTEFGKVSFSDIHVPALIKFLEDWRDCDPEQELVKRVNRLRSDWDISDATTEIIKAVREHDKTYGSA